MATTSNFGWETPDDTDLVKDGAAAMRTLGNSIDTSFVDLKGGTTGQILSKASNTDLDYTWITNDVGDITAVTAGTGITGGGTSGAVTVSFDQANYGGGQYAAGKNKIINGDFSVWQRGTTFTSPANNSYTADRFSALQNGTGTSTISQQAFTLGTAPVTGYEGTFFLRHLVTAVGTSTVNGIEQRIESVRTFANQTVTFSFWAKADSARTISVRVDQFFGGTGSAAVTGTAYTFSATTSWTRFSQTITVPSIAGKTVAGGNDALYFKIFNANTLNSQMDIWGVQLEAGSTATPFQTASGGSQQAELAMCQRYFAKSYNQSVAPQTTFSSGYMFIPQISTIPTGNHYALFSLPITMRTAPTVTYYSVASGTAGVVSNAAGTDLAASSAIAGFITDAHFTIKNNSGAIITPLSGGFIVEYIASAEL